ncbi:MAG: YeeE/YedE family protein [Proteobacteria bacterium]|nr:YeeE/YedE family protein [Pseudomonadota bacterium]
MLYSNEILGGLLIGLASALPLLYEGRIAGVSGYAASALRPKTPEGQASLIFVIGLIGGGILWRLSGGQIPDPGQPNLSFFIWALAGLLVGYGSRLGGGCTSGHGVCGIGRMSPRSLASVFIFMGMAMLTNFVMRLFV